MRVFVIGIDALEYDLVKKWNLKELKQKEYGKVKIPKVVWKGRKVFLTVPIWVSFYTGVEPEIHGVKTIVKWKNPMIQKLTERLNYSPIFVFLGKILEKLKFRRGSPTKDDIKIPTLFDKLDSIFTEIPGYNFDFREHNELLRLLLFEHKITYTMYKRRVEKLFEKNLKKTLEILNNSNDFQLFMCYFKFLDSIQHCCFKEKEYIRSCYLRVEDVVRKIKKKTNKDDLVLIISDHGFDLEGGDHSDHGFYSSNKHLGLKNPKITDFFNIILKFAKKELT